MSIVDTIKSDLDQIGFTPAEIDRLQAYEAGQIPRGDVTDLLCRISMFTVLRIDAAAMGAATQARMTAALFRAGMAARAREARSEKPRRLARVQR